MRLVIKIILWLILLCIIGAIIYLIVKYHNWSNNTMNISYTNFGLTSKQIIGYNKSAQIRDLEFIINYNNAPSTITAVLYNGNNSQIGTYTGVLNNFVYKFPNIDFKLNNSDYYTLVFNVSPSSWTINYKLKIN
jgi:hypothetical protein